MTRPPLRALGHPVHAMLVSFPIGLLALVPVWDGLAWLQLVPEASRVAYWTQLAGLIGAVVAAAVGARDLSGLLDDGEKLGTGLRHAFLALVAISIVALAFALRPAALPPGWIVCGLDLLASACLLVSGWFGGHLVFHHRVGVDPPRG